MTLVKTIRVRMPVVDAAEVPQILDLVTAIDGVVGALVDTTTATLEVIVARAGNALLVREELRAAMGASAAA